MLDNTLFAIEVAFANQQTSQIVALSVKPGTTIEQAILQSGICCLTSHLSLNDVLEQKNKVGIFGELKSLQTLVKAGDRVEIYCPLPQSPMALRKAKVPVKTKPKSKSRQRPVRDLG